MQKIRHDHTECMQNIPMVFNCVAEKCQSFKSQVKPGVRDSWNLRWNAKVCCKFCFQAANDFSVSALVRCHYIGAGQCKAILLGLVWQGVHIFLCTTKISIIVIEAPQIALGAYPSSSVCYTVAIGLVKSWLTYVQYFKLVLLP